MDNRCLYWCSSQRSTICKLSALWYVCCLLGNWSRYSLPTWLPFACVQPYNSVWVLKQVFWHDVHCLQYWKCCTAGSGANPISPTVQYAIATDECPECLSGSLDLAQDGDGRWSIDWYPVQCNVGDSAFQYSFQGSLATYVKMAVTNTRYTCFYILSETVLVMLPHDAVFHASFACAVLAW